VATAARPVPGRDPAASDRRPDPGRKPRDRLQPGRAPADGL